MDISKIFWIYVSFIHNLFILCRYSSGGWLYNGKEKQTQPLLSWYSWSNGRPDVISEYHFNTSIIKILLFQFLLRELSWVNLISIRSVILIIEISYKVTRVKVTHDTRSTMPTVRKTQVQSLGQGRSPGEGNGNPLQYSCLENPQDGGAGRLQSMRSQRVGHDWVTSLSFFPEVQLPTFLKYYQS